MWGYIDEVAIEIILLFVIILVLFKIFKVFYEWIQVEISLKKLSKVNYFLMTHK